MRLINTFMLVFSSGSRSSARSTIFRLFCCNFFFLGSALWNGCFLLFTVKKELNVVPPLRDRLKALEVGAFQEGFWEITGLKSQQSSCAALLARNSEIVGAGGGGGGEGRLFPMDLQHMNVFSGADSNVRVCTARTEPSLKIQWMFEGHLSLCWQAPVALCAALIRWSMTNMQVWLCGRWSAGTMPVLCRFSLL